jgi:hypothetical protein
MTSELSIVPSKLPNNRAIKYCVPETFRLEQRLEKAEVHIVCAG